MDRKMCALIGMSVVGCAMNSQMALEQGQEVITTKAKFIVHNNSISHQNELEIEPIVVSNPVAQRSEYIYQENQYSVPEIEKKSIQKAKKRSITTTMVPANLLVAGDKTVNISTPTVKKSIKHEPQSDFTIQIIALSDDANFEYYIDQLSKDNPMWLNAKEVEGSTLFALLYGEYASKEEAELELKKLPKIFIGYGAFIQSFSAIKKSAYPNIEPIFK